jgi:hypothetical protein
MLFSKTLTNTSLSYYRTCPIEFLTTWEKLSNAFISHFYLERKVGDGRRLIQDFKNHPEEGLIRAFVRYKDPIYKCALHGLPNWYVLHIFYGGPQEENRIDLDLVAAGYFMDCSITNAWALLDKMRRNRESMFSDLGSESGL